MYDCAGEISDSDGTVASTYLCFHDADGRSVIEIAEILEMTIDWLVIDIYSLLSLVE